MQKYTKEFAEKVRQATDIVKVINGYTPLTKQEDVYVGASPFSKARLQTLVVFPQEQAFKDFATKEAGNVITFVAHKEKISFDQALEKLAKTAHITISESDHFKDPQATLKKNLYSIMDAAANFYSNQIKATGGEHALEYVGSRGIEDKTMKQFRLGFAPATGKALYNYLKSQGFTHDVMIASGLIKVAEGQPYDYFRNRLMFPIWNKEGQVVAFTGRMLQTEDKTKSGPKYVNSATSPIFNKSESLYGINFAKTTQKPYYVLVEGQMDVIKLHQAGYDNVVAISGTAFTEKHCQQLATKTHKGREVLMSGLMIATDGDTAGKDAKKKIIRKGHEFLPFGMRVVEWPQEYKDPDELIEKCGKEIFMSCLSASIPADNYLIRSVYEKELDISKAQEEIVQNFTFKEQKGMSQKEIEQRMASVFETLANTEQEREL